MDDSFDPRVPKQVGFRTYADDTVRPERAYPSADAGPVNNPWRQSLHVRRGEPPAHQERGEAPAFEPVLEARRRSRAGPLIAGAAVCAAAVVGLVLAHPNLRGGAGHPAPTAISGAPPRPLQVAQALPLARAAAQPAASPPSDTAPAGLRVEVQRAAVSPAPRGASAATSSIAALRAAAPPRREPTVPRFEREPVAPAPAEAPVRVFVHITGEAQLPAADRIRSELHGLRFADQPVATPPVRFVPSSPRTTEVRCLKHADCPAAHRVARYLAQDLRAPVAVVDMSRTYEQDPAVRKGSLELWLRS